MSKSFHSGPDHTRKVSRLPPLPEQLDPLVTELFADTAARGGHTLNLHLVSAHAPRIAKPRRSYTTALRT